MHRIASQLLAGSARHARRSPSVFRVLASRSLHHRVQPPYNVEDGMGDFLPPASLKMIAEDYQQGLLDRLNDEVKDTPQRPRSVVQTVIEAAQDPSKALMFSYASEALNNSFFLQCLKPPRAGALDHEDDMSQYLSGRIREQFGSVAQLKSTFGATALGMFGSGWVWLVCDQSGELAVIPTFGAGTLLVRSQVPIQTHIKGTSTAVIGEEPIIGRPRGIPGVNPTGQPAASSPASGVSSQQHPPHPPTQTRQFSSSALRANDSFRVASLSDHANRPPLGDTLFPLLCVSVHEHAWVSAGYGVWGKEEYMKRFWSVVNWEQVSRHYAIYAPDRSTADI
ncbi:manganese and iron superoxide dismutase [Phanerochaete sordida]|uniref:Manganese and iron superoxide dismutase n=1 Tax=Phanerochaete sordida TaxID=48140 RepID=A0A9P3FY92_9APHY|nr:manganese and iron superoxide dismutase [Phanerochaete sordida]